jgi:hypothetical protein
LGRALLLTTQSEGIYSADRYGLDESSYHGEAGTQIIQPSVPVRVTVYGRWELLGRP